MTKKRPENSGNVRRLSGAGDGPLEPQDPHETFEGRLNAAFEAEYDQFVVIACKNGKIEDIFALRDNRHEIRGILEEAFPIYDAVTSVLFSPD
jgi:hypothetical protein